MSNQNYNSEKHLDKKRVVKRKKSDKDNHEKNKEPKDDIFTRIHKKLNAKESDDEMSKKIKQIFKKDDDKKDDENKDIEKKKKKKEKEQKES